MTPGDRTATAAPISSGSPATCICHLMTRYYLCPVSMARNATVVCHLVMASPLVRSLTFMAGIS